LMFNMRRKINKSLIFSSRFLDNSHADGTIYNTQGFVHAVKSHQLDVGDDNSNLSWPLLSQFLDETFQDTASSPSKVLNAGSNLYGAVQLMQRDMQVPATSYFSPELNLDVITITTEQGHRVDVVEDRHGFPAIEGLSGYGLVIDMAWAKKREYNGEPMTWRTSIESPSAHVRQDEIWGSYSLQLMHEKTHGLIRGAAGRYVNRTAGIV